MPLVVVESVVPGPNPPGGDWLVGYDLDDCVPGASPGDQALAADAAADLMFSLSGHQFGTAEETVRPYRVSDLCGCAADAGDGYSFGWTNHSAWARAAACACSGRGFLRLLGPVTAVDEVRVDGVVLDEADWSVWDGMFLARDDGGHWPCFPAGTLVLTDGGMKPIEEVQAGEMVLTHRNRWRRVLRSGQTGVSETVLVSGRGGSIRCTPDHRFLASEVVGAPGNRKLGSPDWVVASDLVGSAWAMPRSVEALPVVLPDGWESTEQFWRLVGRWVGDGWTDRSRVTLCVGKHEEADVARLLSAVGGKWRRTEERTVVRFRLSDAGLAAWLRDTFGTRAHTKQIPPWLLGADESTRRAFLDGYVDADGWVGTAKRGRPFTSVRTVSRALAVGVKLLASSLGHAPLMYEGKQATDVIEGRHVSTHTPYRVDWPETKPGEPYSQAWADDEHLWGRVRSVDLDETVVPVYDLEVEDDHSFIAEGFVVHNCCQDLRVPSTEVGTWAVTYTHGIVVPAAGRLAAQRLACELLKLITGGDCVLNGKVQSVVRDGVSAVIVTDPTFMSEGRTGIAAVDVWISSLGNLRGGTITLPGVRGLLRQTL